MESNIGGDYDHILNALLCLGNCEVGLCVSMGTFEMDNDGNNQNHQPTEDKKYPDQTQAEYREISQVELKQILKDHKKWLESDGKEGKKANFYNADLKNKTLSGSEMKWANFYKARLQKANVIKSNLLQANFIEADMQKAELWDSNLKKADLRRANLQKTNLNHTNLKRSDLRRANLQDAHLIRAKLQHANLSKADLQNATLDGVKGLNEAENLRYVNFQGATGLLGNEFAQTDVTGTKLPDDLKEFKALETIKETSQNARKIFFAMLLGCVYSWLTIATTTDVRLLTNTASSPLPIIGTEIPIAWFYTTAPLVLIALYLYFHFYLQGLWESLASLPAIFPDGKRLDERAYPWLLNRLVRRHFKRLKDERPLMAKLQEVVVIFLGWWVVPITMVGFWARYLVRHDFWGTFIHLVLLIFLISSSFIFYRLCKIILEGKDIKKFKLNSFWYDKKSDLVIVLSFILILLSHFAFTNWSADFREKDISTKPGDYYKIESAKKQIESVKGANLNGRNLNQADMYQAFLVKADLRKASLKGANLISANLQQANLEEANLSYANFEGANLMHANLKEANLMHANLKGAKLMYANLAGADLTQASLEKANLESADLKRANLMKANLKGAKFLAVELEGANFQETEIVKSRFLGYGKLKFVKTLYKAKLGSDDLEEIKKCCPHLLEKPKDQTEKAQDESSK